MAARRSRASKTKNHDETSAKSQYSRQAGGHPLADSDEHDIAVDREAMSVAWNSKMLDSRLNPAHGSLPMASMLR
jgi:hypothetical protein